MPPRGSESAAKKRRVGSALGRMVQAEGRAGVRFVLEELREFAFLRYADSAEELRDYIAQRWRQTRLDDATCLRAAAALRDRPGARLWLHERVVIRRLRPL